jgi:hypothetical protein
MPNQKMTRLKTIRQESTVENQIVIQSPDGTFRAYIFAAGQVYRAGGGRSRGIVWGQRRHPSDLQ